MILLVLLPTSFLAWLGQRIVHNEKQMVEVQVKALINTQLTAVDDLLKAYFQTLQNNLLKNLNQLDLGNESLKKFSLQSAQVTHILVIDADGKRVFPLAGAELSEAEKKFLQRTSAIFENL